MEKRFFTRVKFVENVSINHDNQLFFGDIQNICLQGLFIKTKHSVPLQTSLQITVFCSPDSSIHLNANVVRCEASGIGLQIRKMDVNSFVQLRNVVATQCNDHGRIMRETYKVTNCIH
ncbi:MAG: PilZ domain-containing protein [Steroidobacteraceae bacterium]|nr:PilZ domain-containing protein [Deltaproteobacteria bacterium]